MYQGKDRKGKKRCYSEDKERRIPELKKNIYIFMTGSNFDKNTNGPEDFHSFEVYRNKKFFNEDAKEKIAIDGELKKEGDSATDGKSDQNMASAVSENKKKTVRIKEENVAMETSDDEVNANQGEGRRPLFDREDIVCNEYPSSPNSESTQMLVGSLNRNIRVHSTSLRPGKYRPQKQSRGREYSPPGENRPAKVLRSRCPYHYKYDSPSRKRSISPNPSTSLRYNRSSDSSKHNSRRRSRSISPNPSTSRRYNRSRRRSRSISPNPSTSRRYNRSSHSFKHNSRRRSRSISPNPSTSRRYNRSSHSFKHNSRRRSRSISPNPFTSRRYNRSPDFHFPGPGHWSVDMCAPQLPPFWAGPIGIPAPIWGPFNAFYPNPLNESQVGFHDIDYQFIIPLVYVYDSEYILY